MTTKSSSFQKVFTSFFDIGGVVCSSLRKTEAIGTDRRKPYCCLTQKVSPGMWASNPDLAASDRKQESMRCVGCFLFIFFLFKLPCPPISFDVQSEIAHHTLRHKQKHDLKTANKHAFSALASLLFWFCTRILAS